ncbi:hypothetical protein M885DRAFT_564511 [Pelagophyceae sp. CCMP2097]|nr:hypothetical protein M885DRAFT_564511 [Pelagophyceae sp. CCMP2097]
MPEEKDARALLRKYGRQIAKELADDGQAPARSADAGAVRRKRREASGSAVCAVRNAANPQTSPVKARPEARSEAKQDDDLCRGYCWGAVAFQLKGGKGDAGKKSQAVPTKIKGVCHPNATLIGVHCGECGSVFVDDDGKAAAVSAVGHVSRIRINGDDSGFTSAAISADVQHGGLLLCRSGAVFRARGRSGLLDWDRAVLFKVPSRCRVTAVACGAKHSLVSTADGALFAWGDASAGQLGNGDDVKSKANATRVLCDTVFSDKIACGTHHSGAIDANGRLWTWGWSEHGRLGHDLADDDEGSARGTPALATDPSEDIVFDQIACGSAHTLAIGGGAVFGCGWNEFGQACGRSAGASSDSVRRLTRDVSQPAGDEWRYACLGAASTFSMAIAVKGDAESRALALRAARCKKFLAVWAQYVLRKRLRLKRTLDAARVCQRRRRDLVARRLWKRRTRLEIEERLREERNATIRALTREAIVQRDHRKLKAHPLVRNGDPADAPIAAALEAVRRLRVRRRVAKALKSALDFQSLDVAIEVAEDCPDCDVDFLFNGFENEWQSHFEALLDAKQRRTKLQTECESRRNRASFIIARHALCRAFQVRLRLSAARLLQRRRMEAAVLLQTLFRKRAALAAMAALKKKAPAPMPAKKSKAEIAKEKAALEAAQRLREAALQQKELLKRDALEAKEAAASAAALLQKLKEKRDKARRSKLSEQAEQRRLAELAREPPAPEVAVPSPPPPPAENTLMTSKSAPSFSEHVDGLHDRAARRKPSKLLPDIDNEPEGAPRRSIRLSRRISDGRT